MIKIKSKPYQTTIFALFFILNHCIQAQTKKIKRPSSSVGVASTDTFVKESFDIYDKVYLYETYAQSDTPLDDSAIDFLEDALNDVTNLSASAPNVISDLDGQGALKQAKATLQINKAKKALKYSLVTIKELLAGRSDDETSESTEIDNAKEVSNDIQNDPQVEESPTQIIEPPEDTNASDNLEIYSKFDFVPGDKLIFFDDFYQDFIGDFPSKWNTNGSGEVVKLSKAEGNWFEFKPGYGIIYLPLVSEKLPEEYTIEFDLFTEGLGKKTSSTARLYITLDDNNGFSNGKAYTYATIPFGQYGAFGIQVRNTDPEATKINATVTADIRKAVVNNPHISIAVNQKRFRMWINEKKYVDVPQFIFDPSKIGFLKFNLLGTKDGEERIFIQNLKIAEGGIDLRKKLMSEGRVSTNGILFDSGSANIKPQSYGIIRQISQVLSQDEDLRLNIIGHTDADGSNESNLSLSKARADAVKNALVEIYNIASNRLQTEGKGESEPVGDNTSSDGKAQNRRVEFVKI
ncbi:OmpA family protein [Yeosuana sp. MJ-SS3]|uniref:OmpA family protein n=1 Tax=Gilvirhabdus luticola TaxID=3079858 RepID=A0ABU3U4Q7_9FLAO|nr:OmpA family protein [Yeosuana sp. MJ-SS3]MDU8885393.1 OmpA family protein [Yeosuana sp. MJ-SS3]